jgi:Na+-translocating ferredoxin:NAD+ oxidoreductase RnfG subunit
VKRINRWRATLTAAVTVLLATASGGGAQDQVLLSPAQALHEIFPRAASYFQRDFSPTAQERSTLAQQLGRPLDEASFPVLAVYDADRRFLGFAAVTEERGRYRPITFMVGVRPDGAVQDVAVMVYRETRGGEVRQRRFLAQYRGKTVRSPIATDRDIINVSGATISVRSMNAGVRKVLAVVQAAFGGTPPAIAGGTALRPIGTLR